MFTDAMGSGRAHSVLISGSVVYKASQRTLVQIYVYNMATYCLALMSSLCRWIFYGVHSGNKTGFAPAVQHRGLLMAINDRQ